MSDRCLVTVVNALEGYRLALDSGRLERGHEAMILRMYMNDLVIAEEYYLPVQPYRRWFEEYVNQENKKEYRR